VTSQIVLPDRFNELRIWNRARNADEAMTLYLGKIMVDIAIKPGSDPNCFNSIVP
jgi:hypothetical protein